MTTLSWLALGFGVLGVTFGVRCYVELWRWAKQCQRARIVVAYNRKVQLDASLAEWLGWVNQLDGQDANGRVVYRNVKVSVAILKRKAKDTTAKTTVKTIRQNSRSQNERTAA